MPHSLASLAKRFELDCEGPAEQPIEGVCGLADDRPGQLSFVAEEKHLAAAAASRIGAFVTRPQWRIDGKAMLFHAHPEYAIARIAAVFAPSQLSAATRIDASAVVDTSARIDATAQLGANVVVGGGVEIGPRTRIFANVVIMDRCRIGADCHIYPNCTLREDTQLGDRVILQPGVCLGGDGYGFVQHQGEHVKIPQLGRVVLENDVEVGANSTIDRARFSETRVGRGTKIDNLVMLAHNVVTGEHCLLVSQVGISGSTRLGNRVTLAGQVGLAGHITVADDVIVMAQSGVTKNIRQPGVYAGLPLKPARLWRRAMSKLYLGLK